LGLEYTRRGNLLGIHLTEVITDGTRTHTTGVHAQYIALHSLVIISCRLGTILGSNEPPSRSPPGFQLEAAAHTPGRLFVLALAAAGNTGGFFFFKVVFLFAIQHGFQTVFNQRCKKYRSYFQPYPVARLVLHSIMGCRKQKSKRPIFNYQSPIQISVFSHSVIRLLIHVRCGREKLSVFFLFNKGCLA